MKKNCEKGGDCAKVGQTAEEDKRKPYGNRIMEKKGEYYELAGLL
jgi:hypothetical protein